MRAAFCYAAFAAALFQQAVTVPISTRGSQWHLDGGTHWVDSWASMPQLTEVSNLPPAPYTQPGNVFFNSTIRQTIQVSIPGKRIRLRLSNAFGATDLPISAITIALPVDGAAGTSKIQTRILKSINFSGKSSIIIPNGALAVSDPIDFEVKARTTVAITMYLESGQQGNDITSHPGSRTTSFFSHGNHVSDADLTDPSTSSAAHWYFISALEVLAPTSTSAFVVVGDSITDGRGSETNNNNRWADLLSIRLLNNPRTSNIAIANEAAGGNRVLHDGLGPNALGRIDRDVLAQSGVKYALIYEGINDIGTGNTTTSAAEQQDTSDRLIWAYQQIAERIQTAGIKAFIATITPFMYPVDQFQPTWDAERERTRQRVNKWIRENDVFDGVVDFDAVLRDPAQKNIMQARYSSGDYLHPNVLGYQTLANAFPLDLFS